MVDVFNDSDGVPNSKCNIALSERMLDITGKGITFWDEKSKWSLNVYQVN